MVEESKLETNILTNIQEKIYFGKDLVSLYKVKGESAKLSINHFSENEITEETIEDTLRFKVCKKIKIIIISKLVW